MPEYFHLARPDSERLQASTAPYQYETRRCALTPDHGSSRRINDLAVEVKHNKRDELMISTWMGDRVIHASLIAEFEKRAFTGFRLRPATVRFRDGYLSTEYSELIVVGWAGLAKPESGIHVIEECPGCKHKNYSKLEDVDHLIDWNQWTGEDFFIVWPLPRFTLVTTRVVDALKSLNVKSYSIGSLRNVAERQASARSPVGFTVGRLSNFMPDDVAVKYGRPLGLE